MSEEVTYKGVVHALVKDTDPILSQEMPRFDFDNPVVDPIQLAYDLVESMRHHKGIGLSANQIGLPYRVFAMEAVPAIVCFNPKLIDESSEDTGMAARCFLHELDHMNGTKYIDRASFIQKEIALKRQKKLAKLKRILK